MIGNTDRNEDVVKVAVIADSHANHLDELDPDLLATLIQADFIIHLGDCTSPEFLDELRSLRQVCAVVGNHDEGDLRKKLPTLEVVELAGKRLGLIHGMTFPFGSQSRILKSWFKNRDVDAILFGHTHLPVSRHIGKRFVFNPGTACGLFPAFRTTIGMLTLDGSISGEILQFDYRGPKPPFRRKCWAMFIRWSLNIIQTWPYVDLLGFIAGVKVVTRRFGSAALRPLRRSAAGSHYR